MTRELKLALIVGFALVLVVTVLISDHLSHARQTKLASLPTEPSKVTEPQPIALEAGADTLPQRLVTEPVANEPQPIDRSMPGTDFEPVIIAQGSGSQMPGLGGATPLNLVGGTQPYTAPVNTGMTPVQTVAANPSGGIEEVVRSGGGRIEGDVIYIPGIQTNRQVTGPTTVTPVGGELRTADASRAMGGTTPALEVKPVVPASPDLVHVVVSGESMFKICQKHYGDGKVWRKLVKYNGMSDSKEPALKIGQKINIPTSEVLLGKPSVREVAAGASSPIVPNVVAPGRTAQGPQTSPVAAAKTRPYVVKKGDTLAAIAQRELGTVKRAKDILELNKKVIKNADSVPLGATIQLPG